MAPVADDIFHVGLTVEGIEWHKEFLARCLGMQVLSDSPRQGDWISEVTGLPGFRARNVYMTPDGINRLEMFEIAHPPLTAVPLSLGTCLGVSHVRIAVDDLQGIRHCLSDEGLSTVESAGMADRLIFQDRSGLFWEIVSGNAGGYAVRVVVSDLDRSMELYAGILGLDPLDRVDDTGIIQDDAGSRRPVALRVQRVGSACGQVMDLCQYEDFIPLKNPRDTINYKGFHHIAFRVADAAGAFDSIRSQGYRYVSEPLSIPEGPNRGGLLFYFYDGDGTVLECLQPPYNA